MYKNLELDVKGRIIRGSVRTPEGEGPFPTVIFLHGFNVDRCGFAQLHEIFAKLCAGEGIATVKFDFYGVGESEGNFNEMTIGHEAEEAAAIYRWTAAQEFSRKDAVFLGGQSMGALIAGMIAPKLNPAGLILWSPALTMYEQAMSRIENLGGPWGEDYDIGGMTIGRAFLEECRKLDFLEESAGYDGPVLIMHGELDEQISPEVDREYLPLYKDPRWTVIPGASHQYLRMEHRTQLFRETLEFMKDIAKER